MDQNQSDKTLYIDKFKEQVELLLNPYEHPIYLKLLGLRENPQKKFKKGLDEIIEDNLTSSNNDEDIPERFRDLKTRLQKEIDIALKEETNESGDRLLSEKELKDNLVSRPRLLYNNLVDIFTDFKKNYSSEIYFLAFIKSLEKQLVRHIEECKKCINIFIQGIIRRDTIKEKQYLEQFAGVIPIFSEPNDKTYIILDDIIKDLWTSFSKSLLGGEFIKDAEYSKKLEEIITKIKNIYDTNFQVETIYLHPILPFIHELCQELSYMCLRIGVQIEDLQEEASCKRKVFHAPVSDLARKLYAGGVDSGEMLKARLFHDLGKKLIEMTRIDISGIIDDQAIPPLLLLYKQCERLKDDKKTHRDFPTDRDIKAIFKAICAKTSLLLFQSFYKPVVSAGILDKNESIKNPYTRAINFEILYEGNIYYVQKENVKEDDLLHSKIKEFNDLKPFKKPSLDNSTDKPKDIKNYNAYVTEENKKEKGKEECKDVPQNEKKQNEILKGLLNDPKNINTEHLIYFRSLDSLLALMKRLKKMKEEGQKKEEEKENYNTSKYAQALGHLLKCFSEWIQSYKDFVSAEQKRNKFEDSFYEIDQEGIKQQIFISSYGCKLIHTQALQDEAYPKYNRLYRQWISEAQDEAVDRALMKINKYVSKRQEKAQKETTTAINKVQADSRRESISTLSIFVALLSFISGGINILQGETDVEDYLILTSTLYFFIAAMIFFLYFKAIEGDNPKKKFNWEKIVLAVSMGIAVILIAVGLCIKYYNKTEVQDSKGSLEMNVKVENFKQASPNEKQTVNPASSSDSSKTSDVIKGDQGKKKTENASKEQQKKQGKS